MSTTAMVNLWGRTIGAVSLDDKSATATFEYDSAFTSNNERSSLRAGEDKQWI
ncbi:MAG: hypothetical protein WCI64_09725 [Chlorobium sp.]